MEQYDRPWAKLPPRGVTDQPNWDFFEQCPAGHVVIRAGVLPCALNDAGRLVYLIGRNRAEMVSDFGGHSLPGESGRACLLREMKEELGNAYPRLDIEIRLRHPSTLMLLCYDRYGKLPRRKAGPEQYHLWSVLLLVRVPYLPHIAEGWDGGDRELTALEWFDPTSRTKYAHGLWDFSPYLRNMLHFYMAAQAILRSTRASVWIQIRQYFAFRPLISQMLPRRMPALWGNRLRAGLRSILEPELVQYVLARV